MSACGGLVGLRVAGLGPPLPARPLPRHPAATALHPRLGWHAPPLLHSSPRSVVARDRKLTGVNTDQLSHGGGDGGGTVGRGGGGAGGGSGGGGGSNDNDDEHPRRALALEALKWLAVVAAASAALVAVFPSALSHPLGLKTALAIANLALPEAVSLQLDSFEAGWKKPLQLRGLRVVERISSSGGSSRSGGDGTGVGATEGAPFDPSSSDEEEEEELEREQLRQAAAAQASSSRGGAAHARRRHGGAAAAGPGAHVAAAAGAGSSGGKRRRTLVSVERISVAQTLLQLLRGSQVEVVVAKPQIDCTLAPCGKPRLLAVLQEAGQVPQAHPAPSLQQQAGGAAPATVALGALQAKAGSGSQSGSSGGGKGSGGRGEQGHKPQQAAASRSVAGGKAAAGSAAAAAAAAAMAEEQTAGARGRKRRVHDDSSDSDAEEAPTLAQAAAAAAGANRRAGDGSSRSSATSVSPLALLGYMRPPPSKSKQQQQEEKQQQHQEQQQQQQQQQQREQVEEQQEEGGGKGSASSKAKEAAAKSGIAAAGAGSSAAAGGSSKASSGGKSSGSGILTWLPESLQHATSAVAITGEVNAGKLTLCLSDGALLVPSEVRELLGRHLHFEVLQGLAAIEQAAADEEPAAPPASSSGGGSGSSGSSANGSGNGSGSKGAARKKVKWARQRPAVLLPWGTGMPQTPVAVRLDGQLMQFRLEGWQTGRGFTYLPRPVEASMEFTPALSKYLLTLLNPALGGAVGMRGSTKVQAQLMPHNGLLPTNQATLRVEPLSVEIAESPVLRQTVGVLSEAVSKLKVGGSLRAELSPIQATLGADGQLKAERLDIRIKTGLGPWKHGLHLVSWGSASMQPPQSLDATLCVPGDALQGLGLPDFPDGSGLPLHISGTPTAPKVEIARASRDLALLAATQQASSLVKSKGGPAWLADKIAGIGGGTQARGVQMPPPLE